ncbi:MAG: DUF4845 domain-containing protein [Pseudomonadota bacterium]
MQKHRQNLSTYQTGLTKWGWMMAIVGFVFVATAAMRMIPHYMDYQVVQSVADRLPKKTVHNDMSKNEIMEHFRKQFRVENFTIPVKDMMTISRDQYETVVEINYEVREHLFHNIDVVLVFSDRRVFE